MGNYVVEIVDTFPFPAEFAPIAQLDTLDEAVAFAKASLKLSRAWHDAAADTRTPDGEAGAGVSMTEWLVREIATGKILYDTSADPNAAELYRYPTEADLALIERARSARGERHYYIGDIQDVRALAQKGRSG